MSRLLNIITNPNSKLRKKSIEVSEKEINSPKFREFCLDMVKTMKESDGVGLAAPQIGKSIRFIVVNLKDGEICMVNPKITKKSLLKEWGEEGCLSVPCVFGEVKRHKKIVYKYLNPEGKEIKDKAEGLLARIIQHEIDHLDGILFIDKAKDIKKIDS